MGDRIFVGRDREMVDLHGLLQRNERVAIAAVGMSGVGKTTLARHYVKDYKAAYPGGVWWLSARSMVTDILGYVERMGMRSELPTDFTEVQIVQYYFDRWHQRFGESKLVVLDDVEDYGAVKALLPNQGSFQVLMTTKVKFGKPVKRLDLGMLRPSAAFRLLRSHIGDDEKFNSAIPAAKALCEWLGCLPLAIELVGRYLAQTGTIVSVLGQLKGKALAARAIDQVPDEMDYALNVRAAIELSWEPLSDEARRVAMVAGVFALAPIGLGWLQGCLPDLEDVEEILDLELVKRSLLEKKEQEYQLHSLVWEFVREKLNGEVNAGDVRLQCAFVINEVGLKKYRKGHYLKAIELLPHSLEIHKSELGNRHPDTAKSLNNLAELYRSMGRYESAEPLLLEAMEIMKEQLGNQHPDTAKSLSGLGALYYSTGHYELAEPLLLEAMEIMKEQLGDRHPSTAQSLNNLGELYRSMGRYESAEPLYLEAIEIMKEQLSDRHPAAAQSLNGLGALYYSMGRYESAEPLYLEAIEIMKEQLGDRHPSAAQSLNNLGELYRSMRRYESAEPLLLEAMEIMKEQLGDRHPSTAQSLNNLAVLYHLMGSYDAAELLHLESLTLRKEQLGNRHPDTAQSLNNLAIFYCNTNRFSEAFQAMSECLSICEELLGREHPDTVGSREDLQVIQRAIDRLC